MAYFDWQDDYSVNVREIDEQHKQLVGIINTLHEALQHNRARDVHWEIMNRILDYAATHFETEEKYMKKFDFPGYREHKSEHERFAATVLDLQGRTNAAGFVLALDILHFLQEWLQNHMINVDKAYAAHFAEHGLR